MIENEIVTKAIEYILQNVWDNVTLEKTAKHCHVSISYLSKIFKEQTGSSVYAFIKKVKMEQSAMKLKMEREREITDIGEDYGYSASNYSTAFSQYHKMAPSEFRKQFIHNESDVKEIFEEIDANVKIEYRPDYLVMYERTIGNYSDMKYVWCDFVEHHKNEIDDNTVFFERTFDDPMITDKNKCIYDICMTTMTPERYKNTCVLQGGRFAIYHFQGYIEEIFAVNQKLIGVWFPFSHNQIDERYSYDRYFRVEDDGYMEFEICIPIK